MLIKLWLEAIWNKICMLAHYIHRRLLPSFNKNGILTCDSEIIEGSWRCQLNCVPFSIEYWKRRETCSKTINFYCFVGFCNNLFFSSSAILHCNWLKIMVIVSDLELHSLASMLDRNKNRRKKNMHIEKVWNYN